MQRDRQARAVLARRNRAVIGFIGLQFRRQLRQHFNAVRISRAGRAPILPEGPVVIYSNHPSWWDAVVYVHLARTVYRSRIGYGPMDQTELHHYPLLDQMGIFGIALDRYEGAARFLALAKALFSNPAAMLWVTAEGNFTDPSARPIRLRKGISHLAAVGRDVLFVPLAIDYRFWDHKRPELLLRFGDGILGSLFAGQRGRLHEALEEALTGTLDALTIEAAARSADDFECLLQGRSGINPLYDIMRLVRSMRRRDPRDDRPAP